MINFLKPAIFLNHKQYPDYTLASVGTKIRLSKFFPFQMFNDLWYIFPQIMALHWNLMITRMMFLSLLLLFVVVSSGLLHNVCGVEKMRKQYQVAKVHTDAVLYVFIAMHTFSARI